jgi:hypothetical protein
MESAVFAAHTHSVHAGVAYNFAEQEQEKKHDYEKELHRMWVPFLSACKIFCRHLTRNQQLPAHFDKFGVEVGKITPEPPEQFLHRHLSFVVALAAIRAKSRFTRHFFTTIEASGLWSRFVFEDIVHCFTFASQIFTKSLKNSRGCVYLSI